MICVLVVTLTMFAVAAASAATDEWISLLRLSGKLKTQRFLDEQGNPVDMSKEAVEHRLIKSFVSPKSTGVLELGARYGTSSCAISHQVASMGTVVSLEADASLWSVTATNLRANNCTSTRLVKGVLGVARMRRSRRRNGSKWTTVFEQVRDVDGSDVEAVNAFTPQALQAKFNVQFDTMVVDCEGCFGAIIQAFPAFIRQLETVILEADYGLGLQKLGYVNYTNVKAAMLQHGFTVAQEFLHPCCNRIPNRIPMFVFQKRQEALAIPLDLGPTKRPTTPHVRDINVS
jgi:FkbM family methyltransferase